MTAAAARYHRPVARVVLSSWGMSPLPRCAAPDQAARLADIIVRTGLDPWDAHAAAIADVAIYPILTRSAGKWQPSADLDEPQHIIEISDLDEREA